MDLRNPHQWFPVARALQRRWVPASAGWLQRWQQGGQSLTQGSRWHACWAATVLGVAWRGSNRYPPPSHLALIAPHRLPLCSIIYHAGPTNSGKTYNALQTMRGARSGVYCGPLRWVALACDAWPLARAM